MDIPRTYDPFRGHPNPHITAKTIENAGKQRLKLSWGTVHDAVDALAYMVSPYKPTLIVGISRGGLVPATLLSHKLNVPMATIAVSAYEGTRLTLEKPLVVEGWKAEYDSCNTVIIDDILDTGKTLETIRYKVSAPSYNHSFRFASLVTKRDVHEAIFFAQVPKDVWVQFPWEQEET